MKIVEYTPSKYVTLNLVHQIDHNNAVVKFDGIVQSDENNVVYFILGTDKKSFKVPLKDMSFKVTSPMTEISGMLKGQIREYASDGSFIDNLTDIFPVLIRDSIDGDIIEVTDPRIDLWFDAMQKLYNEVKDEYESGALNGKDGVGIKSIEKTKSEGLVDTYTITLTNDSTFVYSVTNGRDGIDGKSAYELAVENGYQGTEEEWLESLRYDHSEEFKQLADQVKLDAKSAEDSAAKAESAMNEANTIAQANVKAINKASTDAQNAITTSKDNAVQAVQYAQATAEEAIGTKQTEAVQAVDTAKTNATTEITEQKENALTEITQEKTSATEAIETGKTNALTEIETAKDNAIEEIENTGVPLEDIEKLAIKETIQGNPTIISDSAEWTLQKLNVYGQSEQASTTGAQLLDSSLYKDSATGSGVTYTKQSDGSIKRTGTATNRIGNVWFGGSYLESKDDPRYKVLFTLQAGTYTVKDCVLFSLNIGYPKTFTIDEPLEISGIRNVDFEVGKTYNDVIYPMLNEGSTALPFEPYTGGKPSPSPDYPQEIISKEVSSIIVSNGASESQTITLSDPITLRGIPVSSGGNVTIDGQQYISDVIAEKDGIIGTLRNIIRPTLKENLTFTQTSDAPNRTANFLAFAKSDLKNGLYESLSSHFVWKTWGNNNVNGISWVFAVASSGLYISPPRKADGDYTKEEIETLVNGKWAEIKDDVEFYTQLQESTFEPLPEEVQAQYKALKSYYPNTVIQTGCWNEVEYVADTKTWIENKINGVTELALGIGGK